MIDIHCHILPGLDDGPQNLESSLQLARLAVSEGIHTILTTPHYNVNYSNDRQTILGAVQDLNKTLAEEKIELTILPGQEIRIYGDLLYDWEETDELLTLNESNYIYIEFPSADVPRYADKLFYDLQLKGLKPIIVHPERNQILIENPDKLYEFVKNGVMTQLTAASITGKFGKKIREFSQEIMDAHLTHFIASDAHNTTTRGFNLQEAYDTINDHYGKERVRQFQENVQLLIHNERVIPEEPRKIQRRRKLFGFL